VLLLLLLIEKEKDEEKEDDWKARLLRCANGGFGSKVPPMNSLLSRPLNSNSPKLVNPSIMKRRDFLKTSALAGAGALILPRTRLFGAEAASNKLNLALIGAYGRGRAHWDAISSENVVALCDVDKNHLALAAEKFPQARHYADWRKCLDHPGLDAVVICTPDFSHAFITLWAMNRGLHVYCEKPLGNTVEEVRLVRASYLKNRNQLATQVGTQRHAYPNFNRVRELVLDGAIGELESACAWGNRQLRRPGYLPAAGEPPATLDYDLWLGPAPLHPYNPDYFSGKPGANCLQWNMYWDFGNGQVGDMGSHTMDLVWNAIDADLPTAAEAKGEPFNPDVAPVELTTHCDIPANAWRPAIKVSWYQGGAMPESPSRWVDLNKIGHGAMFTGSQGYLVCDFEKRLLIPLGNRSDMTYYQRRKEEDVLPSMRGFVQEWTDACKGSLKTSCNFDYAGTCIEMMLLGLVAYRAGAKIEYDGKSGKVTNLASANQHLSREYRSGWKLTG
jgi:predicted dehydrogenase